MVYLDDEANKENLETSGPDFKHKHWRVKRGLILFLTVIAISAAVFFVFKGTTTFSTVSTSEKSFWEQIFELFSPYKEKERINILVLGLRGEGDPNGGLLTDSMMLISLKKDNGQAALISIPRDLYVEMPESGRKERINVAYELGESKKRGGGIVVAKALVSNITGVNIDYVISFDFRAFKEIVDSVGGINVYLEKPFKEELQWGGEGSVGKQYWTKGNDNWIFYVPQGENKMDGESALYYARSRFSSSDFDRARRQQQILLAIKDKAFSMNFLGNPKKIFDMLDILKRNIETDMTISDIKNLIGVARDMKDVKELKNIVISNADDSFLDSSRGSGGEYILLPRSGNWDEIRALVRGVFDEPR